MTHETHWQLHCQSPPANRRLIALLAFLVLIQVRADRQPGVNDSSWEGARGLRNLARLREYLRSRAWSSPSDQKLFVTAAQAMVEAAQDPYTHLLTPDMARWTQDLLEDRLRGGIGVEVAPCHGRGLRVMRVAPRSPAAEENLQVGDIIVAVDGKELAGLSSADMLSLLRGDAGSSVRLKIERATSIREVMITRQPLAPTLFAGRRLSDDGIGYLLICHFAEGVAARSQEEIQRLQSEGARALILDLRWNPGGALEEALAMADMLLPAGALIVQEEYRGAGKTARRRRLAKGKTMFDLPIAVLLERESASAAELLAAALQEHKRAMVIGNRTFGKGRIQEILPLEGNAGSLRLTVGRYLTPTGRDLEGEGLQPDIPVALPSDRYWEMGRRWRQYASGNAEAPLADDPQASRAVIELQRSCKLTAEAP